MPAEAKLEREIDTSGPRTELYKIVIAFLLMMAPALAFIVLTLT